MTDTEPSELPRPSVAGDDASPVLIASGFGDPAGGGSGGGVFAIGSAAERIDWIASMGLACNGPQLARIIRCRGRDGLGGEVAVYDALGVQRYLRLDGAGAIHDVALDGDDIVAVSTWHNAVRWFNPVGRVVREVVYPGPQDSWHLNCITRREGVWYATMFGPVGPFGASTPKRERAGRIVELTSGRTVVDGLSAPHTPRWFEDTWLVCDSARGELLAVDQTSGRAVRRVKCGDWTRGIAWDDRFLYVGTSHRRTTHDSYDHAEVVVIDRSSWEIAERIPIPAQEVYELIFVSPALHEGLRHGFDANQIRTGEFRQYRILSELGVEEPRTLWPTGEPLPWSDFRCTIACDPPAACVGGTLLELPLRLTNRSRSFFTSAAPAPVYVSYKWTDPATGDFLTQARAQRTMLPRTVFPAESVDMSVRIVVPDGAGSARLRITAIQEGVSWFDDQDPESAIDVAVEISPALPLEAVPTVR
jgi:hypothetical protein